VLETARKELQKVLARCSQNSAQSGSPDCPVVHRTVSGAPGWTSVNRPLSGEVWRRTAIIHRTVRWANGRLRQRSATRSAGNAWPEPTDSWRTGLSGVHRTLSGEPSRTLLQRSAELVLEGDRAPDMLQDLSGGAPDCPMRHPTESKYCLPKWIPMAPRPLGSIKGTPRRLQQVHKCSQQLYTSLGSILSLTLVYISLVCVKAKL
jgi:hypothetical protein